MMNYTAVIRTLGKSESKYQQTLNSLASQTIPPQNIIVYIAEGYPIPLETIGWEKYVYVKKGMVAQRALPYDEVTTEWILFLDDDLSFPNDFVEKLYSSLIEYHADVISPDVFQNASRSCITKIKMAFLGKSIPRRNDKRWAYKVLRNGGYSYNSNPKRNVYESQTNAGACFLCKKDIFLSIHFEEELWMDKMKYALGDDEVMFYKMFRKGYKVLTLFHSGIIHMDAATAQKESHSKYMAVLYADFWFRYVFWHRFFYRQEKSSLLRFWNVLCMYYPIYAQSLMSVMKRNANRQTIRQAVIDAQKFIGSDEYKQLPLI